MDRRLLAPVQLTRRRYMASAGQPRRILVACLAAIALALVLLLPGCELRPEPKSLEVTQSKELRDRLTFYALRTPSLDDPTYLRVLLPKGYDSTDSRYPVLYVLHGRGSNYTWATEFAEGERLTDDLPLIVVMLDGGPEGFYSNWYNGGEGGEPEWETYHIKELVPWVDSEFRTRAEKTGRAIAGASMGGFGAISYAARHPDLFGAAASFSGPLDTGLPPVVRMIESVGDPVNGEPAVWGYRSKHEGRWRRHNPLDLAPRLKGVRVFLFTGNGKPGGPLGGVPDPLEAVIHVTNLRLAARLKRLGVRHRLYDYGPGAHSLAYMNRDLEQALPLLMRSFR